MQRLQVIGFSFVLLFIFGCGLCTDWRVTVCKVDEEKSEDIYPVWVLKKTDISETGKKVQFMFDSLAQRTNEPTSWCFCGVSYQVYESNGIPVMVSMLHRSAHKDRKIRPAIDCYWVRKNEGRGHSDDEYWLLLDEEHGVSFYDDEYAAHFESLEARNKMGIAGSGNDLDDNLWRE